MKHLKSTTLYPAKRFPRLVMGLCLFAGLLFGGNTAGAHEHRHTHASLTSAAFELLNSPYIPAWAESKLRQGVVDEDLCPRYNSHFYNPKTKKNTLTDIRGKDPNCLVEPKPVDSCMRFNSCCQSGTCLSEPLKETAKARADRLWNQAVEAYRAGDHEDAYVLLGRVLHLLQDMTSPSHTVNNPHGKLRNKCAQDADDFENWGWCEDNETQHIEDYVDPATRRAKSRLKTGLSRLYGSQPKLADDRTAGGFIHEVANTTYDFATFHVILTRGAFDGCCPDSELKRMFPSLSTASGGWQIDETLGGLRNTENVGFSDGLCGRSEGIADTNEEWWPMESGAPGSVCYINGNPGPCTCKGGVNRSGGLPPLETEGWVFIENSGGEGAASTGFSDSLIPKAYEKSLYRMRYGSTRNDGELSMQRIYGDVLYTVAAAYGAGLLQVFVEDVIGPPVADAGSFYEGEACTPLTFDGSGSYDSNGWIVSYEWDFDNDGIFSPVTASPRIDHVYPGPYSGIAVLRVTDNEGLADDDIAEVSITPDITPPVITSVTTTPEHLWPPNHKMVPVGLSISLEEYCSAQCRIVSVTSNEPENGPGDGNTSPDWSLTGDLTLDLRAERSGSGEGRVYTIEIECSDQAGNRSNAVTAVTVSKSAMDWASDDGKKPKDPPPPNHPPSRPELLSPADQDTVSGTRVNLQWKASLDSDGDPITYHVFSCEDPSFTGCSPVSMGSGSGQMTPGPVALSGIGLGFLGFIFAGLLRREKTVRRSVAVLIILGPLLLSCGNPGTEPGVNGGLPHDPAGTVRDGLTFTVSGLNPGKRVYWKVVADDGRGGTSESETWSFMIPSE